MSGTPLDLFPARIKIADDNGYMTPEFYRALRAVVARLGGSASDAIPEFVELANMVSSPAHNQDSMADMIVAPTEPQQIPQDVVQPTQGDVYIPDTQQTTNIDSPMAYEMTMGG